MTYSEFANQVKQGKFFSNYLIVGGEDFLIEDALRKLLNAFSDPASKDFNLDIFYGNEVDGGQILDAANAYPMMADFRVVVVKDVQRLSGQGLELLAKFLEKAPPTTRLIMVSQKTDFRNKSMAKIKSHTCLVECRPLYEREVPFWLRGYLKELGYTISDKALLLLQTRIGSSLREIVNEVEKIVVNLNGRNKIEAQDVENVVGLLRNYSIFDLTDAIGSKHLKKSLMILNQMLQSGEQPTGILAMITRHFVNLSKINWAVSQNKTQKEMSHLTGIPPFFISKTRDMAMNYSGASFGSIFSHLLDTDLKLKSSGQRPSIALESLVIKIINGS